MGEDRQHETIVGRGIDRIVSRDPVIDSSRSVGGCLLPAFFCFHVHGKS